MSYMEYHPMLDVAKETRAMLEGSKLTLLQVIDHNLTQPKPHHKNKDLMTTVLKMEAQNGKH